MGSSSDRDGLRFWSCARLLLAPLICLALAAPAPAATPLRTIVEDVPAATGHSYGTRDSAGNAMHTLKIVKSPFGGYVGVYHTVSDTRFIVKIATSMDLLTWRFAANLAVDASQPTIHRLRWGAALVAYESHVGCQGGGRCVALKHYGTESALLNGVASRTVLLPRALSSCAEGTPNIFSAKDNLSRVDVGIHYFQDCRVDRQARGTLKDLNPATWAPLATPSVDTAVLAAGASPDGNIADRDGGFYAGAYSRVIAAQLTPGDIGSWRNFLSSSSGTTQLSIRTHGGSQAFGSPTFTSLALPNGKPGVVVTQFIPLSAAAPGEAGELVYYRPRDPPPSPTIAGAGDISCQQNTTCHDDETSQLLVNDPPTKVLTMGDNQYEHGELVNFEKYYVPHWGRVFGITMPTPGNHDPPSSGYTPYFGKPPNYSYDLGEWHLIALDSTDFAGATAFLDSDLAQNGGRRCILAYWHHPRFSSDATHGNNAAVGPLWTRLYAAGADVVLNGHAHTYERFAPQTPTGQASPTGIRQFIAGTGGKALHGFGTVRANSEVRLGLYGVLRMTLNPTSYDWRMQGEDGATYDSGSGTCS